MESDSIVLAMLCNTTKFFNESRSKFKYHAYSIHKGRLASFFPWCVLRGVLLLQYGLKQQINGNPS